MRLITAQIKIKDGGVEFSTPDKDTFRWVILEVELYLSSLGKLTLARNCYEWFMVSGFKNDEDVIYYASWLGGLLLKSRWAILDKNKEIHEYHYTKVLDK